MTKNFTSFTHMRVSDRLLQVNSTRLGGYSSGPYQGLNLGMHSGDAPESVRRNRDHWFSELQIPQNRLVFPKQVHSAHVEQVMEGGTVADCDALVTNTPNLYLTIQTADCFPVFLFDPQTMAIGIVHSGWRGTAQNVVAKTITKMADAFATEPQHILAGIGPGVQQSCYQVDDACARHFDEKYLLPDGPGHYRLDVQGRIRDQLLEAGVLPINLQWNTTCTHCDAYHYYSYRRDGRNSGRMMGIIGLRNP